MSNWTANVLQTLSPQDIDKIYDASLYAPGAQLQFARKNPPESNPIMKSLTAGLIPPSRVQRRALEFIEAVVHEEFSETTPQPSDIAELQTTRAIPRTRPLTPQAHSQEYARAHQNLRYALEDRLGEAHRPSILHYIERLHREMITLITLFQLENLDVGSSNKGTAEGFFSAAMPNQDMSILADSLREQGVLPDLLPSQQQAPFMAHMEKYCWAIIKDQLNSKKLMTDGSIVTDAIDVGIRRVTLEEARHPLIAQLITYKATPKQAEQLAEAAVSHLPKAVTIALGQVSRDRRKSRDTDGPSDSPGGHRTP